MIALPDVNVLVYAVNRSCTQHAVARSWLESAFNGDEGVAFAWVTLLGFLRLTTRSGILPRPLDHLQALDLVRQWLVHDSARILHPTPRHLQVLGRLLIGAGQAANLTTDAHIAALAIEHGAMLASFDRDFSRFSGLSFEFLAA